jgi:hypothetical protein
MPDSIYGEEDEQVNDSDEGESNDVVPQQPDLIYNGTSDEHFYSGNLSLTKLHLIIESVFLPLLDGSSFEASESGMPKEGGLQLGLNIDFMTRLLLQKRLTFRYEKIQRAVIAYDKTTFW